MNRTHSRTRRTDRLLAQSNLSRGVRLGRYEIVSLLGAGGMGEVYRARDTRLGRDVAVKVLPQALASDPGRLVRFEREVRAASALSDPHIVAIFDAGREKGVPYFVSELTEGETLRAVLDTRRLSLRKALDLAVQVASGLAAAHARGIVHRDLKPENILISRSGIARIADFGLAKLREPIEPDRGLASKAPTEDASCTEDGVVLGTIGYMSPEQVRGERADTRSDIFSFGSVLYEMFTGRRAFEGNSTMEKAAAILRDGPPAIGLLDPGLPADLDRLIAHCLEKDAQQRFQSARDLAFALQAVPTSPPTVTASRPQAMPPLLARLGGALGAALALLRAALLTIP